MNRYAKPLALLASAFSLAYTPLSEASETLFLVGGGMQSCASQNVRACERSGLDPLALRQAKTSLKVMLSADAIARASAPEVWPGAQQARQAEAQLKALAQALGPEPISKADFTDALRDRPEGEDWYQSLSDRQWFLLIDRLEAPQVGRDGQRLKERVWLEASRDSHTPELVARFTELAARAGAHRGGEAPPTIVVMTSSARDPFEAHDFYLELFASSGAQVTWLPLDASVQLARHNHQCSQLERYRQEVQGNADRARVYPRLAAQQQQLCLQPERGLTLLEQADALFINGGDQWLSWQALRLPDGQDSAELALIKRRFAKGELVVGGTSAGTAVQGSGVMISNGSNARALTDGPIAKAPPERDCDGSARCEGLHGDSLTYDVRGGLGLFTAGLTDTHFSERGRQLRLAKLARHTETPLAVGVDENTALVVTGPDWEVVGAGGVWVWENRSGFSHYLQPGDQARWQDNRLTVALKAPISEHHDEQQDPLVRTLELDSGDFRQLVDELCRSSQQQALGYATVASRRFGAVLTVDDETQFGRGANGHCSYRGLLLQVGEAENATKTE
ncbi:cyanophycinase [Ferrimonas balearica]|uniref:cyanophycinase n=1 Tax=Ferrimonas balearica TaxID=44012 RepID=UPI001C560AA2|nr:cyanophycinase [Ferrimonas balearica]MBW3139347.1 cyanophycinase [Ferrimonas balearica]